MGSSSPPGPPGPYLSQLQRDILGRFVTYAPGWFLTGGGALAGFHFGHRTTDDLDLFATPEHASEEGEIAARAAANELGAVLEPMVRTPDFKRFSVTRGEERTIVDLVIDRAPQLVGTKPLLDGVPVDPVREIAANKISALLGRNAPRDLVDLQEILKRGANLRSTLDDAAMKDASADPATLAWVLSTAPRMPQEGVPHGYLAADLEAFRQSLIAELRRMALPSE